MNERDIRKLIQAAKTAVSLIGLVHQTLWDLYPDQTMLLEDSDEELLLYSIKSALKEIHPDINAHSACG